MTITEKFYMRVALLSLITSFTLGGLYFTDILVRQFSISAGAEVMMLILILPFVMLLLDIFTEKKPSEVINAEK